MHVDFLYARLFTVRNANCKLAERIVSSNWPSLQASEILDLPMEVDSPLQYPSDDSWQDTCCYRGTGNVR